MIITELYIRGFGRFSEEYFRLYDGVQVIYGENEFGKSTLHAFIRSMLFGLERGRGRAAAKDDFTRYEPWEHPGSYGGRMRFLCGGRSFCLERRFDRGGKGASLVCEDDGEELSVEQGDLDMLLGGLTPALFDSTVSVGQLRVQPGQELSDSLKNYAANYYETGGGEIDLAGVLEDLRDRRKEAGRRLREAETERERKREKLLQESHLLEEDMERLRREYDEKEEWYRQAEKEERSEKERQQRQTERQGQTEHTGFTETEGNARSLLGAGAAGILIGLLGGCWGAFLGGMDLGGSGLPFMVIAGMIFVIGILLLAAGGFAYMRDRRSPGAAMEEGGEPAGEKDEHGPGRQIPEEGKEREQEAREQRQRITWEMERIRREWKEKEIHCGNLREQYDEMGAGEEENQLAGRIRALELAESRIRQAAAEMGSQTGDILNRRASEILSELTEGRYGKVETDESFAVSVWDGFRRIPAERLSRGTLEQVYFAVRMAAAEMVLEEDVPLILDETFAFYDEKRLGQALKWLSRQKRQVIILTCHRREAEILQSL